MSIALFANNAASTLASPINSSAVSLTVTPGTGARFSNPAAGQYFVATLIDAATGLVSEIVWVTARSGDTMTIVRAQEGTAAAAWSAGDSFKMLNTAGTMQNLMQVQQSQTGAPNYSVDFGTVNAYAATFSPAVTTRVPGLTVRIKANTANTGASTLNIGAGSAPLINPDGTPVGSGAIVAGGIFEVTDDGTNYQLISASQQALSNAGLATTGDFKWRPTPESISGWVKANALTIGNASSGATQLASATTAALFAWHWNNFSNSQCPVFDSSGNSVSRGVNASADYAANRAIRVIDMRFMTQCGLDVMGGPGTSGRAVGVPVQTGSANTSGSLLGESLHYLTLSETVSYTPTGSIAVGINDPQHFHVYSGITVLGGSGFEAGSTHPQSVALNTNSSPTGITASASFTGNSNGGSNGSHNTVQTIMVGTFYIKL